MVFFIVAILSFNKIDSPIQYNRIIHNETNITGHYAFLGYVNVLNWYRVIILTYFLPLFVEYVNHILLSFTNYHFVVDADVPYSITIYNCLTIYGCT